MTNLPSLPNVPSLSSSLRRACAPLLLLAMALCAMLACAPGAGAKVVTVDGSTVGVAPRAGAEGKTKASTFANPQGNPVVHGENVFAIYWDPTDHYHGDWQEGINTFLRAVGMESGELRDVFSVPAQYLDKTNQPAYYKDVYRGSAIDYHAYPTNGCTDPEPFEKADNIGAGGEPVCLSASQVAAELSNYIGQQGLPKGMSTIYYLLTPPGVTVCLDEGTASGHCSDYQTASEESYANSFCSYHGDVNPGGLPTGDANTILYGVIPFTAGTYGDAHLLQTDERPGWECQDGGVDASAGFEVEPSPHAEEPNQLQSTGPDGTYDHGLFDMIVNQIWLQQENIVTDPLLNAWQDVDSAEAADECRLDFAPILSGSSGEVLETRAGTLSNQAIDGGVYYLNDAFNLAGLRLPYPGVPCVHGTSLVPKFTAPTPVNTGEAVSFDGMESNITQNANINFPGGGAPASNYATYKWNFGDGTPEVTGFAPGATPCEQPWLSPCAASVFHTYAYGGSYNVKLTVTDVGGNVAMVEHVVTVYGAAPPPPGEKAGTGSTGTGSSTTGGSSGGSSGSGSTTPGTHASPVAAASIVSRSLKTTLRSGLSVHYSVNEEVAGHFDVLITAALAKKLKLHGTPVTGLPAGTPPEVMIARSVLVTTKAGSATVHIKFSKAVAARLGKTHKIALLLEMFVRDASSKSPATTTILSSVTLAG